MNIGLDANIRYEISLRVAVGSFDTDVQHRGDFLVYKKFLGLLILLQERDKTLEVSLLYPEWSPREVSCHITDQCGFMISELSVYRILKAEGLIREVQQ